MVTTSNTAIAQTAATVNNGSMLLYNNSNSAASVVSNGADGGVNNSGLTACNTTTTLEQYRLQLYNYALNMERLRGPPYTAAAAMAAAAAYASTTTVSTAAAANCPSAHAASYPTAGQPPVPPPAPTSYLCSTTAGSLISATTHLGRTPNALSQCPTSNRLALASMSLFPQRIFQPEEPKPQHSYIGLIAMAILSSAESKLVLSDIYQFILDNYPYFRTRGPGWRNSIRHNLSLNDCFIKSGRSANGKGHYWAIHPANMEDFRKGDFRRRKAQRKVRKHMGLAVDDNGTDSPSPPPAMDLTSSSPPSFQHIVMGSSTITAAQHLAAQSFGWRFTHQHSRQQTQHHGTAASYMGQIFSYRPHHYAAAAVAAAALCHNNSAQQHHLQNHQQHLIAPTSLQQHHHAADRSAMEPSTLLSPQSTQSTNGQANVINELFSQKRKRQFDVASLLAPDHSNKREAPQQFIRKLTCVSETEDVVLSTSFNEDILDAHQTSNELDIEDIDVVEASEDDDIDNDNDNDYDEHDDDVDSNSNCHSRSRSHSHSNSHSQNDEDDDTEYIHKFNTENPLSLKTNHCKVSTVNISADETILRVHDFEPDDGEAEESGDIETNYAYEEHNNKCELKKSDDTCSRSDGKTNSHLLNVVPNSPLRPHVTPANTPAPTASHFATNSSHLLEQTSDIQHSHAHSHLHSHQQQISINTETHNLFGRYYGTYMAAAAAARINSTLPPANTIGNTE